jgi:hypothetical protein
MREGERVKREIERDYKKTKIQENFKFNLQFTIHNSQLEMKLLLLIIIKIVYLLFYASKAYGYQVDYTNVASPNIHHNNS